MCDFREHQFGHDNNNLCQEHVWVISTQNQKKKVLCIKKMYWIVKDVKHLSYIDVQI